ncbi:ed8e44dd-dfac-41ed-9b3a-52ff7ffd059f [Sclerotinia trifoliorum]|uniref:Ed8e44dd-dfac-41ed-9b3a-52ff7ffd059f n=1 Tax=Sclerotinia trifoliorum TaxID=28548 RepID=A0A8H2W063_9HELO|nr:ed8e44dd-dfac-41ed-9b3a-52ff7ffd059f [Sclerotinia trifoliorum]
MGIPGLWDLIADCKEIISLAELATKHFEHHKRPLRIAVDEATWRHKLFISNKGKVCKKYSTIHLNERNLITFVLRLLKLNIQLIFVADGPQKPCEKNKGKGAGVWKFKNNVLQEGLREGLVLFVIGGDYGKGLQDCGVGRSSKVVEMGFGRQLCRTMEISGDLDAWRNSLRKYFIGSKTGVSVPGSFPDKRIWGLYNSPVISSLERLEKFEENVWSGKIDEKKLQTFFVEEFNWGIDKYIDYVIPILLTRSLTSFDRNGKSNMDVYNLTYMESGFKCKVWYSLFAVTSLGREWVDKCIVDLNKKRPNHWKRYELPWGTEPTVEGRDLLTCIVKHVMEPDTSMTSDSEVEIEIEKDISNSRRRSLSPQRTILEDRTRVKKSRISISPPPTPISKPHHRFAFTEEEISFDISMYGDLDEDILNGPLTLEPKPKALKPSKSSSPPIIPDKQKPQLDGASIEIGLKSIKSLKPRKIKPSANTNSKSRSTQYPPTNLLSDIKTNRISKTPAPLPHSSQTVTANEDYDFINTYHIAMDAPLDSDSDSDSDAECEIIDISFLKPRTSNLPPRCTNYKLSGHNSYSRRTSTSTSISPHLHRTPDTTNQMHNVPLNKIPEESKHESSHQSDFEFANEFAKEFKNDDLIAMDEPLDFDLDPDLDSNSNHNHNPKTEHLNTLNTLDAQSSISSKSISKPSFEQGPLFSNPRFVTHSSFPLSSPFPSDLERNSDTDCGGKIIFAPPVHCHGHGHDHDRDEEGKDAMNTKEDISSDIDIDTEIEIDITTNEQQQPKQKQKQKQNLNPIKKHQLPAISISISHDKSTNRPLRELGNKSPSMPNPNPNPNLNPNLNTNPHTPCSPPKTTSHNQHQNLNLNLNLNLHPLPNKNPHILLYPSHPTGPYQELDISILFSSSTPPSSSSSSSPQTLSPFS